MNTRIVCSNGINAHLGPPQTLKERAEKAADKGPFFLTYAGWTVKHMDVRALLVLARGLQATEHAWQIFDRDYDHWSAWVPGMPKPEIEEF